MRAVIDTPIAGDECLMILDVQLSFVNPDGDTLPCEALFRIEVETLHTDEAIAIDGPQKLGASKELTQTLGLDDTPPEPAENLHGCAMPIDPCAMGPVGRRVKGFDEGRMLILHVFSRVGLLKMGIGEAQLHLKLGFYHVLPGFALLDMERLNR